MYHLTQTQYDTLNAMGIDAWEMHDPIEHPSPAYQRYRLDNHDGEPTATLIIEPPKTAHWTDAMQLLVAMMNALNLHIRPYQAHPGNHLLILGESLAEKLAPLPDHAIVTHALSALLENPALKKAAWQALKPLRVLNA